MYGSEQRPRKSIVGGGGPVVGEFIAAAGGVLRPGAGADIPAVRRPAVQRDGAGIRGKGRLRAAADWGNGLPGEGRPLPAGAGAVFQAEKPAGGAFRQRPVPAEVRCHLPARLRVIPGGGAERVCKLIIPIFSYILKKRWHADT